MSSDPNRPRMLAIQATVAGRFQVTLDALCSERRDRKLVDPRHAAMWICRQRANYTFPEIARAFARHHTTVISAVERVDRLIEERPEEWGALMVMLAAEAGGMGSSLVMSDG